MNEEPLVLVPGLLCTGMLYADQIDVFAPEREIMVADHRRHESIAAIAEAILAEAPAERFALAGLSMGGYIALEIMRRAGQRVTRLALLDTQAIPDTPETTAARERQIAMAQAGRLDEVVEEQLPRYLGSAGRRDERLVGIVRQMAQETGPEAFVRQQRAIIGRADSRPSLGAIRCPTLILVGAEDVLTPPERSREMHEAIPGSRLMVLDGVGHLATIEAPAAVTAAMREWLRA